MRATQKLILTLTIILSFCHLFADDTETITITFNADPGTVSCEPTALRYDKKHAISFDQDDNLRGVYKGMLPLFLGGTPQIYDSGNYYDQAVSSGRFFKDPFGNEIHFRANTVSWVINHNDIDYWEWATGWPAGGRLGYPDLDSMLTVNFGISSHAYYSNIHERGDDTVALCPTFYRNWLEKNTGHVPFSFDQPGGTEYNTDLWVEKWFERGALYGVLGSGGGYAPVRVDNVDHSSLTNAIITTRYSMESKDYSQLKATVDQLMAEDHNYWLRCFSHNLQNEPSSFLSYEAFRDFTEYIDTAYADSIWVPGIHEIIQYFHVRDNVSFTTLAGGSASEKTLQFNTGDIPIYVKQRYLTFTLESAQPITSIDFNGHPANYKSLGGNKYLIDIDLSFEGAAVDEPELSGSTEVPEYSTGHVYSVDAIPGGHYEWILTGDASITAGDSTNSITVSMGAEDPEIHVRVSNDDGNAAYDMLAVTTTHIHYVKTSASGDGSGSSWANADDDLQAAINDGNADQVWVAAGTYYVPDSIGFIPAEGTHLYGGFAGTETDTSQRVLSDLDSDGTVSSWEFSNATILDGDIDHATNPDDYSAWPLNIGTTMDGNAIHVIYQAANFNEWAAINGFTIQGGNANSLQTDGIRGGGVYQRRKLLLRNCTIKNNRCGGEGGGVYNYQSSIKDCYFFQNYAFIDGGGIHNAGGAVDGCLMESNSASDKGGGINNYGSSSTFTNSTLKNNVSDNIAGGIHNYLAQFSNIEIYGNLSESHGGGIYMDQGTASDCNVYDNEALGLGLGGGVYSYRGRVHNFNIYRNTSAAGGGGCVIRGDSISNSIIYDNQTTLSYARGGGLSIQNATDNGIAVNCVIFNNQSLKYGGGVNNDNAFLLNCTVVNNYSADDAGGIYNNSSASVVNTVLWGNDAANDDPQINTNGSISYSAVEGTAPTGESNFSLISSNAFGIAPYFNTPSTFVGISNGNSSYQSELENADWDIGSNSALINQGTLLFAGPIKDIENINRVDDIDIGAYESGTEGASPITLRHFEAIINNGNVILSWETASETENAYFVLYKNGEAIVQIEGAGTTSQEKQYEFTDCEITSGHYEYILADVDFSGNEKRHTNKAIEINIADQQLIPNSYALADAYPNPFNPSTTIAYSLKEDSNVELKIYDMTGKVVRAWTRSQQAGWYDIAWNGKNANGKILSSGLYFYSIKANDFIQTKKMLLLK